MAVLWVFDIFSPYVSASADTYVTCAGTVRAPHGAAIQRRIYIYRDSDQTTFIASTFSDPTTGAFSIQVPGHALSEFTVLVKGEYGENDAVYANANLSGVGPSGLYIAPALSNLPFIVGPGNVTSPFVDVLFPMPVVDAEGAVDIVAWGAIEIPYVVDAEGTTPIIATGDVNFGFSVVDAVVDNYYYTDSAIKLPVWQVNAEASTSIYAWGNVVFATPQIHAAVGTVGEVYFPSAVVSATGSNPIICDGAISFPSVEVSGTGDFGKVSFGSVEFITPVVSGYSVVSKTAAGVVSFPAAQCDGDASGTIFSYGSITVPALEVVAYSPALHTFDPLNYEPDCGVADIVAYGAVEFPPAVVAAA